MVTLKMTTAQVAETSVTVTNSSFQNYTHPDDHIRQTTDTPGFKPFTIVVLFVMLYKVVLTFESVDEILKCDHSNESY